MIVVLEQFLLIILLFFTSEWITSFPFLDETFKIMSAEVIVVLLRLWMHRCQGRLGCIIFNNNFPLIAGGITVRIPAHPGCILNETLIIILKSPCTFSDLFDQRVPWNLCPFSCTYFSLLDWLDVLLLFDDFSNIYLAMGEVAIFD